jgi:AraC-like DNA-binding protein
MLFIFLMIMVGLTNLLSLIRGFTIGYAAVFEYNFMSAPMLLYGIIYAYFFILYPLEAFRPGWLTIKRAALLFTPALFILILYLFETRVFNITTPTFKDLSTFLLESSRSYIFLIILILAYPIFGIAVMLKYRKGYIEWCENNFASMDNIDIKWLTDYIFANLMITVSCLVLVFSNDVRSALMHNIIFLAFFLYGFYRVLFWKSPYPENYFKEGMNESKAHLREDQQTDVEVALTEENNDENDIVINKSFNDRLPNYKAKLVQWMETEKPYLRKEFKLSDALKILPLNRSYLSRLFNEGYGESFYQFVMRYRIEESKRLLLSRPDLNITNIAELSGFSSLSVFGRAFTQKMNCSPIQWREKNLNQNIGNIEKKAEKESAKLEKQLEVVVEK